MKNFIAPALLSTVISSAAAAQTNKPLVQSFFDSLSAGDQEAAFALVDDDASWWVPGNLPYSGTKTKAEYRAIARSIQAAFPTGFFLTVLSMIEENDTVAAEVESHGVRFNGRMYNNKYHFLFRIQNGKFVLVKEYMDTQHLADLIAP